MARPLHLEFPGAVYHVTCRGDGREPIYDDDVDRAAIVGEAADRFDSQVLAYCLMGNHYHVVLHTRRANLRRFMRHLNGGYAQAFNPAGMAWSGTSWRGASKRSWWIAMRTCWLFAGMSNATRWLRASSRSLATGPSDWAWCARRPIATFPESTTLR